MSTPKFYPWTARLATSQPDARKAANHAGLVGKHGLAEYLAWAGQREKNAKKASRRFFRRRGSKCPVSKKIKEYLSRVDARQLAKIKSNGEYDCCFGDIRCGHFVAQQMSRTLAKIGLPVRRILRRYKRTRFGSTPIYELLLLRDEFDIFNNYRAATESQRKKYDAARLRKKQRKQADREELAESLGVLPNSRAFALYLKGEIDPEECESIGRYTRHRHENTNYDALIESGWDKESARDMMRDN